MARVLGCINYKWLRSRMCAMAAALPAQFRGLVPEFASRRTSIDGARWMQIRKCHGRERFGRICRPNPSVCLDSANPDPAPAQHSRPLRHVQGPGRMLKQSPSSSFLIRGGPPHSASL